MPRVALHVDCKRCGTRFDTAIRTGAESFRRGSFIANYHRCPDCGVRETYRKADYRLTDARTGVPVEVISTGSPRAATVVPPVPETPPEHGE